MKDSIKKQYAILRPHIKNRLSELKKFYREPYCWHYENNKMVLKKSQSSDDERLFEELCFCLLTANTSSRAGLKAVHVARPKLLTGNLKELQHALVMAGYRYPNKRAEYIINAREFIKKKLDFKLKETLKSFNDINERRDFIVQNIKGLGYKEGSHFLRNIGYSGYAILDKHIIRTLHELGLIDKLEAPNNRQKYLNMEEKLRRLSEELDIHIDDLDFLLWARKTGEILK